VRPGITPPYRWAVLRLWRAGPDSRSSCHWLYPGRIAVSVFTPLLSRPARPATAPGRVASSCVAAAAVVALAVLVAASTNVLTGATTTSKHSSRPLSSTTGDRPSAAQRAQAASATSTYRSSVADDGNRLVSDVARLAGAVDRGDVAAARSAELAAQSDFDQIRFVDAASPQNVASIDDVGGAVPPGATFGGLHAIERDLWSGGDAAADLASLRVQAAVAQEVVARQSLSPAIIATTAVSQLNWVVDIAVPGREELYSHHDDADIDAGVTAANQAYAAIAPLACTVDAVQCRVVATDLASLTAAVADLGPPLEVPDSALTDAVQRNLATSTDRAADALAGLGTALLPFGTAGPQPYGAATPP
jgi:Imelysin